MPRKPKPMSDSERRVREDLALIAQMYPDEQFTASELFQIMTDEGKEAFRRYTEEGERQLRELQGKQEQWIKDHRPHIWERVNMEHNEERKPAGTVEYVVHYREKGQAIKRASFETEQAAQEFVAGHNEPPNKMARYVGAWKWKEDGTVEYSP